MADKDKGGGKKPTGALNVERRTWDVEHFEKLAKEKLERVSAWGMGLVLDAGGPVWVRLRGGCLVTRWIRARLDRGGMLEVGACDWLILISARLKRRGGHNKRVPVAPALVGLVPG